jgi:undecaprenyl diphosphate synthase
MPVNFKRLPRHIAIIPDGNRRWAQERGRPREDGYEFGIPPGIAMYEECARLGIEEVSVYGYTQDNTKRPNSQVKAYQSACVAFARVMRERGVALQVIGDSSSPIFPEELKPFCAPPTGGKPPKVNFLVHYGWRWDLETAARRMANRESPSFVEALASRDASRIDLVIRWGGRRRLSGMLPIQAVYADFYVLDPYWPDFTLGQFHEALAWYQEQDVTLGG